MAGRCRVPGGRARPMESRPDAPAALPALMTAPTRIRIELHGVASLPPDLDPDEEGLDYGRALTAARSCLTSLAQRLGVRPLHRFEDDENALWDEMEEDVLRRAEDERDAEAELLGMLNEMGEWYDAGQGLETVSAMIDHFEEQDPGTPVAGTTARDVLWDLRAVEAILGDAHRRGRRFRTVIGA